MFIQLEERNKIYPTDDGGFMLPADAIYVVSFAT